MEISSYVTSYNQYPNCRKNRMFSFSNARSPMSLPIQAIIIIIFFGISWPPNQCLSSCSGFDTGFNRIPEIPSIHPPGLLWSSPILYYVTARKRLKFLPRDAMHKRGLCRHAVSVCLSVCLSRSSVASKRIKIYSKFFHHWVATPF